jgi:hypothetical protein
VSIPLKQVETSFNQKVELAELSPDGKGYSPYFIPQAYLDR